jgi:alcohol dehydrogenase class IV
LNLPAAITAFTGIDAFTHCLEAYINVNAHPFIDAYAMKGISLIFDNLPKAIKDGQNIDARSNVALGSMLGGMCLGPVNTAAIHALAYPLGTQFKIAHGLSNAVLLTSVVEYNIAEAPKRYAEIARALGRGTRL